MKEMPADILNKAAEHVENMPQRPPFKADMLNAIANAIAEERYRCASWHDHCAEQFASVDETYAAWHRASAAALRGTS
jgi:hypothetical protein